MQRNYVTKARAHLAAEVPNLDPELAKLYTLLVLVKGVQVTLKDVHDAWAVWKNDINYNHASLVPFEDLSEDVQKLDAPYAQAIRYAARPSYFPEDNLPSGIT